MRFGPVPVAEAAGAVLAHTLHAGARVLKKGRVLDAADVAALAAAGFAEVIAARLDAGDLDEDAAAAAVATALAGPGVRVAAAHTGRANLFATAGGVVRVAADAIKRANQLDEAVTVATVADDAPTADDAMVATVKIIPFAAPRALLDAAAAAARAAITVRPWRPRRAGLVDDRGQIGARSEGCRVGPAFFGDDAFEQRLDDDQRHQAAAGAGKGDGFDGLDAGVAALQREVGIERGAATIGGDDLPATGDGEGSVRLADAAADAGLVGVGEGEGACGGGGGLRHRDDAARGVARQ